MISGLIRDRDFARKDTERLQRTNDSHNAEINSLFNQVQRLEQELERERHLRRITERDSQC